MDFMLLADSSPGEMDAVLGVVQWVFARFTDYVGYANAHPALWIPTGFAIAAFTISLFRSAMGVNNRNNNNL